MSFLAWGKQTSSITSKYRTVTPPLTNVAGTHAPAPIWPQGNALQVSVSFASGRMAGKY
ncbi:hypothetical protein [Kamptonema formosum]|uniref:hypothetical protein n=1 Tax=Kamptonema formosum TaxID=331992 RepID=UPI0003457040|nr:hypothetical protein [Oscillatoria sp. PCC 10802]